MFASIKFRFHVWGMSFILQKAVNAKARGDRQYLLLLLRKATQVGEMALNIESPRISKEDKSALSEGVFATKRLYRCEFIRQMPENDYRLFSWVMQSETSYQEALEMFEAAVEHLSTGRQVLRVLYGSDRVPALIKNTMQLFLNDEITHEETHYRLEESAAKLRMLMQELDLVG